jgi:hypothetical protein
MSDVVSYAQLSFTCALLHFCMAGTFAHCPGLNIRTWVTNLFAHYPCSALGRLGVGSKLANCGVGLYFFYCQWQTHGKVLAVHYLRVETAHVQYLSRSFVIYVVMTTYTYVCFYLRTTRGEGKPYFVGCVQRAICMCCPEEQAACARVYHGACRMCVATHTPGDLPAVGRKQRPCHALLNFAVVAEVYSCYGLDQGGGRR